MPLALSTTEKFRIVLNSDKGQNPEPAFIYRYLTAAQQRVIAKGMDELDASANSDECYDKIYDLATTELVGWENMFEPHTGDPIAFDIKMFDQIIGAVEAQEIIFKLIAQHPSMSDKKKLDSPSDSTLLQESAPTVPE